MRHIPNADLLEAMKESLRNLENLKLISPDDLEILNLRRTLKERITWLERQQSQARTRDAEQSCDYEMTA